jgi:cytochrome P450
VTSQVETAAGTGDQTVSLRDPYQFFSQKRRESGVYCGTVMDYSKTPESLRPKGEYSAMSFNAVNSVFRDSRVFTSKPYDTTIGLFMGPTILAMEGKKHRDHRNLVSAAFRSKALARWEPTGRLRPAHPRPAVPFADGSSGHVRRKVKEDRVVLKW